VAGQSSPSTVHTELAAGSNYETPTNDHAFVTEPQLQFVRITYIE